MDLGTIGQMVDAARARLEFLEGARDAVAAQAEALRSEADAAQADAQAARDEARACMDAIDAMWDGLKVVSTPETALELTLPQYVRANVWYLVGGEPRACYRSGVATEATLGDYIDLPAVDGEGGDGADGDGEVA